jgi:DNA-binding CsgD family transcriptional regulator/N-acetylneuraminic acid mutarotase
LSDEQAVLSEREMEILRLVATGATNHEIARQLIISVNTVKVHLRNIYEKLGVASRTEATMVAVRQGWVQVPGQGEPARIEEEVAVAAEPAAVPVQPVWPAPERLPRVSLTKRVGLVVALLLAVAILFLPSVLNGQSNGSTRHPNPMDQVFPVNPSRPSTSRWYTRAQLPTSRAHLAVAAYGNLVYAIGGASNDGIVGKVEVYDPQTDSWSNRTPKPIPVGFASAGVIEDKIYVPGGIGAERQIQDELEIYDPRRDAWERGASMPEALASYGLAALGGKLYLFGGWNGQAYVSSVYRYDPDADRWETLPPMDQPRGFLGAVAVGDRIYVVGGYDGVTEFSSCDVYDPANGTWERRAPMTMRRGGFAVIATAHGQYLYAIGGTMTGYLTFNERYDPRIDTWTRIETPVVVQWQGLGLAFVSPYIYAIGGWNGATLSVNEAYQPLFQVPISP